MNRTEFLTLLTGAFATRAMGQASGVVAPPTMNTLADFRHFTQDLKASPRMPVLFVGHGSPMNAIEVNGFTQQWRQLATQIPQPQAVLVISAHWLSKGTRITAMDFPRTIHDFGGFPRALHQVQYPAPGSAALARETAKLFAQPVAQDHDWGLDHGAWSIVKQMYPLANIPVLQLSIDYNLSPQGHYDLARQLAPLRDRGVLIMGSGNMVHNLGMIKLPDPSLRDFNQEYGYDWAHEINTRLKTKIAERDHTPLINYPTLHPDMRLAVPTDEHYLPLLYTLALQGKEDTRLFNDKVIAGSLTMTSVQIG